MPTSSKYLLVLEGKQKAQPVLRVRLVRPVRREKPVQPVPKETLDRLVLKVRQDLQGLDLVLALAPLSGCSWRFRRGMPTT